MQINVIQIMEFSQQSTKPVFFLKKYLKIPKKCIGCLLENEKKNTHDLCAIISALKQKIANKSVKIPELSGFFFEK